MKPILKRNGKPIVRDAGAKIFEELLRRGHAVREYEMNHENSITLTISIGFDTTDSKSEHKKAIITHTWPESGTYDIDALDDFMNGKKSSLKALIEMHEALE